MELPPPPLPVEVEEGPELELPVEVVGGVVEGVVEPVEVEEEGLELPPPPVEVEPPPPLLPVEEGLVEEGPEDGVDEDVYEGVDEDVYEEVVEGVYEEIGGDELDAGADELDAGADEGVEAPMVS